MRTNTHTCYKFTWKLYILVSLHIKHRNILKTESLHKVIMTCCTWINLAMEVFTCFMMMMSNLQVYLGEDEQHTWSARLVYPDMVQPSKTFLSPVIGQHEALMMILSTTLAMVERMYFYSASNILGLPGSCTLTCYSRARPFCLLI